MKFVRLEGNQWTFTRDGRFFSVVAAVTTLRKSRVGVDDGGGKGYNGKSTKDANACQNVAALCFKLQAWSPF